LAATLDPSIAVHRTFVPEDDPAAKAARIARPGLRRAGLILAVPDLPAIRDALGLVQAQGLPIVQIVTRATGLAAEYVGIDNEAGGGPFPVADAAEAGLGGGELPQRRLSGAARPHPGLLGLPRCLIQATPRPEDTGPPGGTIDPTPRGSEGWVDRHPTREETHEDDPDDGRARQLGAADTALTLTRGEVVDGLAHIPFELVTPENMDTHMTSN
jgi:hypothetical protein